MPDALPAHSAALIGLAEARAEMLSRIAALDAERSTLVKQVHTLEASMRVLDPSLVIERPRRPLRIQKTDPTPLREITGHVFRIMRLKAAPMTLPEIVTAFMTEHGIDPTDRVHREALRQKVGLFLRKQALKRNSVVRRIEGDGGRWPRWEIKRIEEVRAALVAGSSRL